MSELFKISSRNPNDVTGGGGCLCSETSLADCEPPYIVFYGQTLDNPLSPTPVLCHRCALAGVKGCEGEAVAGGEPIDVTGVELTQAEIDHQEDEKQEAALHELEDADVVQVSEATSVDAIPEI